jgi:hypothetical protein
MLEAFFIVSLYSVLALIIRWKEEKSILSHPMHWVHRILIGVLRECFVASFFAFWMMYMWVTIYALNSHPDAIGLSVANTLDLFFFSGVPVMMFATETMIEKLLYKGWEGKNGGSVA